MGNTVAIELIFHQPISEIGEIHIKQDYNNEGQSTFDRRKFEGGESNNVINSGDVFRFTSHGCGNCNGVIVFSIKPWDGGEEVWFGVGYCTDAVKFCLRRREFRGGLAFYEPGTHLTEDHYQALIHPISEEGEGLVEGMAEPHQFGTVREGTPLEINSDTYTIKAILNYRPNHLISVSISKK